RRSLVALGQRARDIALERAVRALVCVVVGIPIAFVVLATMSALFPLGALRAFEPYPGVHVDWVVVLLGVAATTVVAIVGSVVVRDGSARSVRGRRSATHRVGTTRAGVSLGLGTHFARVGPSGARRSGAAAIAMLLGVAGLVGSGVVALNLDSITQTPARWGVNYDRLFGNPYVEADSDIVAPVVHEPGVAKLTAVHVGSLTIDGRETPTLAVDAVKGGLGPTTLAGRAPQRAHEIGLGEEIARRLHVGIGDRVSVAGSGRSHETMRVVGIVVTPDSAGGGAAVTFSAYRHLNPDATRNVLLARFAPDVSPAAVRRIAAANFTPPDALPVPASVRALRRILPAPLALEFALLMLLLVSGAFMLTLSVRAQRRDFAVLRALGATPSQLRAVVHWQATLVTLAVLVVGAPLGIALGRWILRRLTSALGIVPGADLPYAQLLVVAVATVVVANLLAVVPARRVARSAIAQRTRE
ncbi:MAG: ABC transporter permease, partial [Acidimicrobiia bacterium]